MTISSVQTAPCIPDWTQSELDPLWKQVEEALRVGQLTTALEHVDGIVCSAALCAGLSDEDTDHVAGDIRCYMEELIQTDEAPRDMVKKLQTQIESEGLSP
jgi:hypothetical protein